MDKKNDIREDGRMFRKAAFPILIAVLLMPLYAVLGNEENKPFLFADINTHSSVSVEITQPMFYQGLMFYFSRLPQQPGALWKTDGTPGGIELVKPGVYVAEKEYPTPYQTWVVFNNILYFQGCDDGYGCELWRTDGTQAGTYRLADIAPGPLYANPQLFIAMNGWLYFQTMNNNPQIYRTDGTQVQQVTNLAYVFADMVAYKDRLYFTASDNSGYGLFRTDGTPEGTEKFLTAQSTYGYPRPLISWNGWLYFTFEEGDHGKELWVTDGTPGREQLFSNLNPSGSLASFQIMSYGDGFLFLADDGMNNQQIWWTQGMSLTGDPIPPVLVSGVWGGGEIYSITLIGQVGLRFLFFSQRLNGSNLLALWAIDSPGSQARLVSTLLSQQIKSDPYYRFLRSFASLNGRLYFEAYDDTHGSELWSSDGTTNGTGLLVDINPGLRSSLPANISQCGMVICFSADDGQHGLELWSSDGSPKGTALVFDQNTSAPGSHPTGMVKAGGLLYFVADDGIHGQELWRTDGTPAGTFLLADIGPGDIPGVQPYDLTSVGDWLYFRANDQTHGTELWKTDGTTAHTQLVIDLATGPESGYPQSLTPFGSSGLAFVGNIGGVSDGLFAIDALGKIRMLKSLPRKALTSLAVFGNNLYFTIEDGLTGNFPLWRSDGTWAGTSLVFSPSPVGSQYAYTGLFSAGDYLYYYQLDPFFSTIVAFYQIEPNSGEVKKTDISRVALTGFKSDSMTSLNKDLYFLTIPDNATSINLVKLSAIQNRIELVKSFSGTEWWFASPTLHLIHFQGGLVFALAKPGYETQNVTLFRSDGTEQGTVPLFAGFPRPYNLTPVGPFLFFTTWAPDNHYELFQWDGSKQPPVQLTHLAESIPSYETGVIAYLSNRLYFQGNDGQHGAELWAYNIPIEYIYLPLIDK